MPKNKKNISEEDFQRYLENLMTDAERNAFERELQKNPFETEAIEGLEQISSENLHYDLKELKNKIHPSKQKKSNNWWVAAASVLLIVSASLIWFQLDKSIPIPKVSESKSKTVTEQPEDENLPTVSFDTMMEDDLELKLKDDILDQSEKTGKKQEIIGQLIKKSSVPTETATKYDSEILSIEINEAENQSELNISKDSNIKIISARVEDKASSHVKVELGSPKTVRGKVVAADDSMPIAGATVLQKGTSNGSLTDVDGNFALELSESKPDSIVASFVGMETVKIEPDMNGQNIVTMPMSDVALNEVVVRDNTANQRKTKTSKEIEGKYQSDSEALPLSGMDEFENYLDENTMLPDNYPKRKVVVKLLINLDAEGKITSIQNINETEAAIFEKAKEIIHEGPDWAPEIKNGEKTASKVELKIVFRKK